MTTFYLKADEGDWYDTTTGWWLLRDWPANAPLEARMVGD